MGRSAQKPTKQNTQIHVLLISKGPNIGVNINARLNFWKYRQTVNVDRNSRKITKTMDNFLKVLNFAYRTCWWAGIDTPAMPTNIYRNYLPKISNNICKYQLITAKSFFFFFFCNTRVEISPNPHPCLSVLPSPKIENFNKNIEWHYWFVLPYSVGHE